MVDVVGFTLGGFVAGEGCFCTTTIVRPFADGTPRRRWVFQVAVANRDRHLLEALRTFLGVGSIHERDAARAHWQPTATFTVNSQRANRNRVIPFADRYLLQSAKRRQFEEWRQNLDDYTRLHPNRYGLGPSECRIPGCTRPVRGRGLCRSHYYRETGY
jgi:hypothetical protein